MKDTTTTTTTQIKTVLVGQPKPDTILEEKGDVHVNGNRNYKVWSRKVSRK